MSEATVDIEIDGVPLKARRGAMLIEVADAAGIRIPRFCYHPKLTVAANCRMCLVEVEKAPKPLPACATPVMDGMKAFTRSTVARGAQRSVMEFLLINHPLDCPICDQGGECELQDVAMGYGRDLSRFAERKRAVEDKDFGPLIATDMTRCIHCTRCVRFGEEIGGMPELGVTGRGEAVEIGTFIQRSVDSELSGNVIDLCPVGALTSKPFRFQARAWEMQQRDAIAPHDAVGSNLHVHVARGRVMRVVPRANEAVNEVWISDRDRFSYEGLYADDRLLAPMVKRDGAWVTVDWETALVAAAEGLRAACAEHGPQGLGALCAPSATTEEMYLLQKLVRGLGSENVDHRLRQVDFSDQAQAPALPWLGRAIADLERLDAVLLVGSHARKEHPIVNHRLRKAGAAGAQVMSLDTHGGEFNLDVAPRLVVSPSAMAPALAAVAASAPGAGGGDAALDAWLAAAQPGPEHEALARALSEAGEAAILLGPGALDHPDAATIKALASVLARQTGATLGMLTDGANAAGAWLAGAIPHRGPGAAPIEAPGLDAAAMLQAGLPAYVLLGIEPELDCADGARAREALSAARFVVTFASHRSEVMDSYAHVMLPAAAFAETAGTFVNADGRWQSASGAVRAPGEARPVWRALRVLANLLEIEGFDYRDAAEVLAEIRERVGEPGLPEQSVWSGARAPAASQGSGVERIGFVPPYACDALVRRAPALQSTRDAAPQTLGIGAGLADRLGLEDGAVASVKSGAGQVSMTVSIDDSVPDGCARIACGVPETVALGAASGSVEIEKQ